MPKSKPAETPRKGVNIRITDELQAMLETSAADAGRSVGAEIEQRLLASFAVENNLRVLVREEMRAAIVADREAQRSVSDARSAKRPEICGCDACGPGQIHASDCAVHREPAYPNGPCDCDMSINSQLRRIMWA